MASSQGATAVPYAATGYDQDQITGDPISQVVGVRIATPIFGTGFNFCIGEICHPPSWLDAARQPLHMVGWFYDSKEQHKVQPCPKCITGKEDSHGL